MYMYWVLLWDPQVPEWEADVLCNTLAITLMSGPSPHTHALYMYTPPWFMLSELRVHVHVLVRGSSR